MSLSQEHQLAQVKWVLSNGFSALMGHYFVNFHTQNDMNSVAEYFMTNRRRIIALTRVAELEPDGLIEVISAPLLRVPFGT